MKLLAAILAALGLSHPAEPAPATPIGPVACAKPCAVSDDGYEIVRTFEGYMPFPYKDVAGIETVGYGYVIRPGDNFEYPMLPPEANALLKREMTVFERDINKFVQVSLYQNQFDALGSFTYNVGSGALRSSTLLKRINAKEENKIRDGFLMWNKARIDGVLQPVKGLTLRREEEAKLYAGT